MNLSLHARFLASTGIIAGALFASAAAAAQTDAAPQASPAPDITAGTNQAPNGGRSADASQPVVDPAAAQASAQPAAPSTSAATSAPTAPSGDGQLADIVVTAERREQRLQDVPIAATVLTAGSLAAQGVTSALDLQKTAPSTAINTYGRSTFINIRGVGIALSAPTSNPGVAFYLDGQLIPHELFIGQSFYDINSIEVLRGPQGTLTGQNSTGGAIYVRTPDPQFNSLSGFVEQTFGDYSTFRTVAAVNLSTSDNVAIRIAGTHDERGSFTRNIGLSGTSPGNSDLNAIRVNLALRSDDERLKVNVRGEYFSLNSDNVAVKNRFDQVTSDPFTIEEDARGFLKQTGFRLSAEGRYDILDGVQVRALTSYQKARDYDLTDGDRTATAAPRPPASNVGRVTLARTEYDTFINEVNLLSTGNGPFKWVVGGFLLDERIPFFNNRDNNDTVNYVAPTSSTLGEVHNNSKSVFGQGNLFVTSRLELIAGLRYSWDHQTFYGSTTLPAVYYTTSNGSKSATGKAGINYHLSRDLLAYATYSRGYKAGGANVIANVAGFRPEHNTVYEAGFKSEILDRHLRLNVDAFKTDYSDIQFNSLLNGLPLLQNAASGKSWGAEGELTGQFGGLAINGSIGYLDAKFSGAACLNNTNNPAGTRALCPSASATQADELVPDGRRLPYSPKMTANAGIQYAIPVGGDSTLTPRFQWSHLSSQEATPFPSFYTDVPGHDVFDLRITAAIGRRYIIEGFVTNIFNRTYIAAQVQTSSSADGGYIYGPPRQFGVRGTIKFGS